MEMLGALGYFMLNLGYHPEGLEWLHKLRTAIGPGRQVPTRTLLRFVRALHLGGVGYYPESQFVHADVGRVRFWKGH